MSAVADHSQRQQALDPQRSFAVAAPAGSGKTGLLTQRVLTLLTTVESPEEILCLTFTRKAAGEMQHRILQALELASQDEPEESYLKQTWQLGKAVLLRDKEKNWQLTRSPSRLRVTTIDSFCRNLALQLGPDSGLSDTVETQDYPIHLYQQAITEVLLSYLDNQDVIGEAIRTLLIHQQNNLGKLADLLESLLAKREQWLQHIYETRGARERLESYLQETITSTLSKADYTLSAVGSDIALLADYAANHLAKDLPDTIPPEELTKQPLLNGLGMLGLPEIDDDNFAETIEHWQALTHLLMTKSGGEWRKPGGINKRMGFPTAKDDPEFGAVRKAQLVELLSWCKEQPGLLDTLEDIRNLPLPNYPDNQWQVLESLTILLPILAAQLGIVFQERNQCDYSEIILAASRALGDSENPTDLALRLDYQIRHILVDEFQDTSTIQYRLLGNLTRGWEPDDGRTLFVVGDGMQSLYSFRNANVGLFLEARKIPLGMIQLAPLDLVTNFRSQSGIIDWTNEVFASSFPQQDNINRGAVRYSPATAIKPALEDLAVTIDGFHDYSDNLEEAHQVLALITAAKQLRPDDSTAILVRDRGQLKHLLPVLRDAGLSWTARDIEPITDQMAVIDLLSLTKALLDPTDRIAWLSVLRAPWCGLSLQDLYQLTNTRLPNTDNSRRPYPLILQQLLDHQPRQYQTLQPLSDEGRSRLAEVAPLLLNSWQQRQRKPLRVAIEGLWRALGGDIISQQYGQYSSCISLLNLIEQHENNHTLPNWDIFKQAVNRLYAEPDADADPKLEIMTVHKAKGLEFDTVIMPGLNRKSASGNKPLLLWREGVSDEGQPQLIISPREPSIDSSDPTFQHLKYENTHREQLENIRVMYVGATRAVKKLHLLYSANSSKSVPKATPKTAPKVTKGSLLDAICPWLTDNQQHPAVTIRTAPEQTEKQQLQLPSKDWLSRLPALPPQPVYTTPEMDNELLSDPQLTEQQEEADDLASLPLTSPELESTELESEAQISGTVLHRIIRQITLDGIPHWQQLDLTERHPFWQLLLQNAGSTDVEQSLPKLTQAITTLLEDTDNHWIFDNDHPESASELELGYTDPQGKVRKAIVDRTFVKGSSTETETESCRWVIDYKMSQPGENETKQAFLQRQKRQYHPQLQHYAELLANREPLSIRAGLYFPVIGHFEEIAL